MYFAVYMYGKEKWSAVFLVLRPPDVDRKHFGFAGASPLTDLPPWNLILSSFLIAAFLHGLRYPKIPEQLCSSSALTKLLVPRLCVQQG